MVHQPQNGTIAFDPQPFWFWGAHDVAVRQGDGHNRGRVLPVVQVGQRGLGFRRFDRGGRQQSAQWSSMGKDSALCFFVLGSLAGFSTFPLAT